VRTYGFDSVVAEAVLAAGSEPQDMAARLEAWNAVKDVTTASWQELFIGGGSRKRKAKQQPSAAAAAAAAGAGTDGRGRGGASTACGGSKGREVGQRTCRQAGAAADAVQLHRGDVHLLAGLRQPAAAAAAAGAGVGDAPGGANLQVTGQAARTAGATAAASRQQRGGGRRRGRGRTQQQQQQQRQAAAHGVAGQAAGLGVSRVPGQQLHGFRQQGLVSSAAVQGGSRARYLRQMGIGDYIR
jgi:U3 small nucleolar RNA-associated protein 14